MSDTTSSNTAKRDFDELSEQDEQEMLTMLMLAQEAKISKCSRCGRWDYGPTVNMCAAHMPLRNLYRLLMPRPPREE